MMSKLILRVDLLAGTDVRDAVQEAKDLAIKLDLAFVCFNFNGVKFSISQAANVDQACLTYHNRFIVEGNIVKTNYIIE